MGARIEAREGGFAPLKIEGTRLSPIEYTLPVPSAQVKSAVLLAGLFADGVTSVIEPVRTRDHTELALAEFGARVDHDGRTIRIHGRPQLKGATLAVPGDLSSAVFFLAAAMVLPESNLVIHNVGLNPTRSAVLDVLGSMGAPDQPGFGPQRARRTGRRRLRAPRIAEGRRHRRRRRSRS